MIDFGFDKILLIGTVALVVLGPEKLPRTARTIGHLIGKAQRYVADVKSEVNRSIELEELQKMKSQFETAARDVEQSVHDGVRSATDELNKGWGGLGDGSGDGDGDGESSGSDDANSSGYAPLAEPAPGYKHPGKKWRLKRSAVPQWFKQRAGVRRHAQSGAARVARFRPPGGFPR